MTIKPAPICIHCQYYRPSGVNRCRAYPNGIPETILLNKVDHRRPEGTELTTENGAPITFKATNPIAGEKYAKFIFEVIAE